MTINLTLNNGVEMPALGVSNFMVSHLDALRNETTIVPAVNQIEVRPYLPLLLGTAKPPRR